MNKNMKYVALLMIVISIAAVACSGKKEAVKEEDHHERDAKDEKWVPMDEFHMVMAESFHPYKDSSNLVPAKANAQAMADAASKWQGAPLPEKVDTDEVKAKLEKLKASTATFVETVKGTDDKVIADSLTSLHDLFHEIQESWYGSKGEHHHH
jgi:hypothetical protein